MVEEKEHLGPIVYYDGQCSICVRTMKSYKVSSHDLFFIDLHSELPEGVSLKEAKSSIHVLNEKKLYKGVEALQIIWDHLDSSFYHVLSKITKNKLIYPFAVVFYVILSNWIRPFFIKRKCNC